MAEAEKKQGSSSGSKIASVDGWLQRSQSRCFSGTDIGAPIGVAPERHHSFVALAVEILGWLARSTPKEPTFKAIVLEALLPFVQKKYLCPRQSIPGAPQLWRLAMQVFLEICTSSDLEDPDLLGICAKVLAEFIRTTRIQDPPPNPTRFTQEEIVEDEVWECAVVLDPLGHTPRLFKLFEHPTILSALEFASRFEVSEGRAPDYGIDPSGMDPYLAFRHRRRFPLSNRKKFAAKCLELLLPTKEEQQQSQALLVVTRTRVLEILKDFAQERPLWFRMPPSMLRRQELEAVLCYLEKTQPWDANDRTRADFYRQIHSLLIQFIRMDQDDPVEFVKPPEQNGPVFKGASLGHNAYVPFDKVFVKRCTDLLANSSPLLS